MNPPRTLAAVGVTGLSLAAGLAVPVLPSRVRFAANLAAAGAAVALARGGGVQWSDLGVDRSHARAGVRSGAIAVGVVTAAAIVASTLPTTTRVTADARVLGAGPGRAAYEVLVRIPLATALAEEAMFRGGVLGAWQAVVGTPGAVAISSVAFGVWHVLPALEAHTHNPAGLGLGRADGRAAHVGATVLATTLAGAVLAGLRLRSRSLVAPVMAHAAINQAGYLVARWAHRSRQD